MEFVKSLLDTTNQMILKPDAGIQDLDLQAAALNRKTEHMILGLADSWLIPIKSKLNEPMVKANCHARSSPKTSPKTSPNSMEEATANVDRKPDYRRRDSVLVMDIIGNSNRSKDRENRRKSLHAMS